MDPKGSEDLQVQQEKTSLITEIKKISIDRTPTQIANEAEYIETLSNIREIYEDTELWHGTGRYKYDESGEVVDIFDGILQTGGLVPHADEWDRGRGIVNTVSLAPSRMYARLYAGLCIPHSERIENELGARELWGNYFFGTSWMAGILEYKPSFQEIKKSGIFSFSNTIVPDIAKKALRWGSNVTKQKPHQFLDIFLNGSDIEGNYPILIGVKKGVVKPIETSKFMSLHERRSELPIMMGDFSHIEVPKEKVEEVKQMLQRFGYDKIPVIPIEYGEEYCRQFKFGKLVSGKTLI
jgi:hypothetical protein